MKKFKINVFARVLSFVLVTMLALPLHGDTFSLTNLFAKIALKHSPLKYIVPGKRISLDLNIKQEAIKIVRCYFKAKGKDFRFVEMSLKAGTKDVYTAVLPAPAESAEGIEYAFMTVDEKGNVVKTQTYEVKADAAKPIPSQQNVASEGPVKVFTELGEKVLPEGFADEIVMDIIESSLRYGFNAGFYSSAQMASAGGASGSAATATTTAVTAAAPLSTAVVVGGIAVAGAGAATVAGGGGGGGGGSSPPATVTGVWKGSIRCQGQSTDIAVGNITLNESSGGSFSGSGSGTDYTGLPLQFSLTGTYNSSSHLISGELTTTSSLSSCVRKDTFSVTLTSNDTGYIPLTQTQVCGCTGEGRLVKQ